MVSKSPVVRGLRKSDLTGFYQERFSKSVRGIAVELDGEPVAVAFVINTNPFQAVSKMKDELRKYPKTIIKAARAFRDLLKMYDSIVYAIASSEEANSRKFLKYVGFEQLEDEVFTWQV